MRNFLDVLRFELRVQLRSPMFVILLLLFFAIHLLTISQVGINLTDNKLIHYNSVHLIFTTELVLGVFGMLPAMMFVVNAATRDHSQSTAEFFYTTPVSRLGFLFGRFSGGTVCALLVGLAGLLGTMSGTSMPWVEAERVAPFAWQPYAVCLVAIVVPNILVFSAFSFSVALLSRSALPAFAMVLVFVVLALVINGFAFQLGPDWLAMLEPFGALAVSQANHFWSLAEINTRIPVGSLPLHRLLWLALGALAIAMACWRFRLELTPASASRPGRSNPRPAPAISKQEWRPSFGARDLLAQLMSQLRVDLRSVVFSPFFWVVMVLAAGSIIGEVGSTVARVMVRLPIHPVTSHMLGFFRAGVFQFALMVIVFYSALLMHRERERRLHEILGASPYPDWVMLISKVLTLCLVMMAMLAVSMLVCIGWQAAAGYYDFEIGVYLQSLFVNTGFYFCMLCVLACVLQTIVPGKWSGMLIVFSALIGLMVLPALGFENLLYTFSVPFVVYTDMNGFGHFLPQMYSMMVYWGAFCVLLLVAGHLLLPRGSDTSIRVRVRDATSRLTRNMKVVAATAAVVFAGAGAWIYYNTHILNPYQTVASRLEDQAEYERRYSSYKTLPEVSATDVTIEVDLYPKERRLVSRGRMTLRNSHEQVLNKLVVSMDPRLTVDALELDDATRALQDVERGFYVFNLNRPLQPGSEIQLKWSAARLNRGFSNSGSDTEILENGTFVNGRTVMPIPIYDESRQLTDDWQRQVHGLKPAQRLPALGDPAYLNTRGRGFDGPVQLHVTFSTEAEQTPVVSGILQREWVEAGRRYATYEIGFPSLSLSSARYKVARDSWNGVPIEVYYDPRHSWNVGTMLRTSKGALEYYSREFGPYIFPYFHIVEFPGYEDHAQGFAGTVPFSDTVGFLTDLRGWAPIDITTTHELAHMWWGALAYGAQMQGRKILNEGMAEYSSLMFLKQQQNPLWLRQVLQIRHDSYLNGRKGAKVPEQPVIRAADEQPHLTYGKSAHVMFALQELLGAEKVNRGLHNFLDRFGLKPPPYPTSLDLVKEIRAVAGPEYQSLITDLFEKIMLYDVQMTAVEVTPVDGQYDVTMDIAAGQFEADGVGRETEVPLDTWFQVVLFPQSQDELLARTPMYQAFHRLHSGVQRITVRVPKKPGAAGVDPFHLMIDKNPDNNVQAIAAK